MANGEDRKDEVYRVRLTPGGRWSEIQCSSELVAKSVARGVKSLVSRGVNGTVTVIHKNDLLNKVTVECFQ